MKKIIILKGLPASGKSTWAKQYIAEHPDTVRVNKDDIRAMLHNSRWSKSNEKETLRVRDYIIMDALEYSSNVIVDDTNLNPTHEETIRTLAEGKAEVEIKEFFDITLEDCIARDKMRAKSVGEKVIRQMYNQYLRKDNREKAPLDPLVYDESLPLCVVFDIDGTLATIGDRSPYDSKSCHLDIPNISIVVLNKLLYAATNKDETFPPLDIILLSGRKEESRDQTTSWLLKHGIEWDQMFMRATDDNRKDSIIKKELFEQNIKDKYNVLFIVDDRDQVVEMWRSMGITCLQCNYGDF